MQWAIFQLTMRQVCVNGFRTMTKWLDPLTGSDAGQKTRSEMPHTFVTSRSLFMSDVHRSACHSVTPVQPVRLARAAPRLWTLFWSGPGSSFRSDGQSVRSATDSMLLNVVTDKGRCVWDSSLRAPTARLTSASSISPRVATGSRRPIRPSTEREAPRCPAVARTSPTTGRPP